MEVAPAPKKIASMHRSSFTSNSSKAHKGQTKHRPINKPEKSHHEDFKLNKHTSFSKNEKRGGGQKHKNQQKHIRESEIQKAFALHSTSLLGEQQCLFSLKILGCLGGEESQSQRFRLLWKEKGIDKVDMTAFHEIYNKLYSKQNYQNKRELFGVMAKSNHIIDKTGLEDLAKLVNWKGDVSQIFKGLDCQKGLTFEQFNRVTCSIEALQ